MKNETDPTHPKSQCILLTTSTHERQDESDILKMIPQVTQVNKNCTSKFATILLCVSIQCMHLPLYF